MQKNNLKDMDNLFTEFPEISTDKWLETIRKDLKGKEIGTLVRKTIDGLQFKPFYRKEETEKLSITDVSIANFPFIRGTKESHDWFVRQDFCYTTKSEISKKIKKAIEKNVDIIGIDFGKSPEISFSELHDLIENLNGLALNSFENIEEYYDFLVNENLKKAFLNFDPITYFAFVGKHYKSEEETWKNVEKLLLNPIKEIKTIGINVKQYADSGASPVMQLAFALSIAEEYFNFATQKNINIEKLISNVYFNFSVGTEYFMEISKIRAFRYLFAKFVEAYDPKYKDSAKAFVHLTTSRRNKTIYDAPLNMLRTTIEGLAGIVAGVDSLNIEPFNVIYEQTDSITERIALNQQIILKEEAYLDKVVDPSGGAYYIENLTVELISQAWELFLKIQDQGGFFEALKSNFISKMIEDIDIKEKDLVNTGKISILGTNKYPNRTENLKELKIINQLKLSDLSIKNPDFNLIKENRLAEEFENLRLTVEKSNKIPKVFLFTFGNPAMRRARADFAGNFFAVGGFEIIDNLGFNTLEEGISAITKNIDIVVLCSSDDSYLEMAKFVSEKIKGKKIVIAGAPETKEEIQKLGIKDFINVKSNIYTELKKFIEEI